MDNEIDPVTWLTEEEAWDGPELTDEQRAIIMEAIIKLREEADRLAQLL